MTDTQGTVPHAPRILLVDDLPDDREIYGLGLALLGFVVTLLRQAEIAAPGETPAPDVIVLHPGKPQGWSVCDALGSLYPAVPVVVITAAVRPDGAHRQRARATPNCAAFVGKPCTHLELAAVIARVLAGEWGVQLTSGGAAS